jgi:hypothetical protein
MRALHVQARNVFTADEFRKQYGEISPQTFYKEIAAGRLKTFKVGRRRYVSREAAEQWRREREREAAGG